jgi:hypothetical protein
MGLKKRKFGGSTKKTILRALTKGPLSKRELLERLRDARLGVSVARLQRGLAKLISQGRVIQEGARADARFRRAKKLQADKLKDAKKSKLKKVKKGK